MNIEMQTIKKAADLQPLNDCPAGSVDPRFDIHVAALNQANIQRQVQENQKPTAAISIFHRFQNLADSCGRAGYTIAYHVNNSFTDITFYCV